MPTIINSFCNDERYFAQSYTEYYTFMTPMTDFDECEGTIESI